MPTSCSRLPRRISDLSGVGLEKVWGLSWSDSTGKEIPGKKSHHCFSRKPLGYVPGMSLLLLLLILFLLFGGLGFAVHVLWWALIIIVIVAIVEGLSSRRRL